MTSIMKHVFDYLNEGIYPSKYSTSEKRSLRKKVENFVIKDGVLYYCQGWKFLSEDEKQLAKLRETVWDEEQKVKLVMAYHTKNKDHHLGHQKLMLRLSDEVYWVGMHADVRRILKMCHSCEIKREVVMDVDNIDEDEEEEVQSSVAAINPEFNYDQENSDFFTKTTDEIFADKTFLDSQAKDFWDVVELNILGPYPVSPESEDCYYVAVFIDVFSAWPEAFVMENKDLATLMMALFTLICRRGVMKKIVHSDRTTSFSDMGKVLNVFSSVDCPVDVEYSLSTALESTWQDMKNGIEDFVVNLPTDWFKYIEFFLLPFRLSRAEQNDYTASYLSSNREMRLPAIISHQTSEEHRNLHLSETQMQQSVSALKELFFSSVDACEKIVMSSTVSDDDNGDVDCTSPSQSPQQLKHSKKRRSSENDAEDGRYDYKNFYLGLLSHLQGKGYPSHYNSAMKRNVRKVAGNFLLINDILFHRNNSGEIRRVVMYEEERWKLLMQSHIVDQDKHLNTRDTYRGLLPKYFWRGMFLDTQAFIQACPLCKKHPSISDVGGDDNTVSITQEETENGIEFEDCSGEFKDILIYLKDKTVPVGLAETKKEALFKAKANMFVLDEEDTLHYLNANYVDKSGRRKRRKVIFTPEEKVRCLQECHVIPQSGKHKSKSLTHSSITLYYYWPNMSKEVARYIRNCAVCSQNSGGPIPEKDTPGGEACRSVRSRKRTTIAIESELQSPVTKKKVSEDERFSKRIEKFGKLFDEKGMSVGNLEEIQTDHGYSIHYVDQQENYTESQLEVLAGNEVEVHTETQTSEERNQTELAPLDSSLQTLLEAVATAKDNLAMSEVSVEENTPVEGNDTNSLTLSPLRPGVKRRKVNEKYKCPHCGLLTGGPVKLKLHISQHTGEKPFTCQTCGAKVTTVRSIRQHYLRHRGELNNDKNFLCDVCGKDFRSKVQLRNHKLSVHPKSYNCSYCDERFSSKIPLSQHEELCKTTAHEILCEICSKVCSSPRDYRAHVLSHVGLGLKDKLQLVKVADNSTIGQDGSININPCESNDDNMIFMTSQDQDNVIHGTVNKADNTIVMTTREDNGDNTIHGGTPINQDTMVTINKDMTDNIVKTTTTLAEKSNNDNIIHMVSNEVCEEEVIHMSIELPEGIEHNGIEVPIDSGVHQSLLQLAEQVVKSGSGNDTNVEYQILCQGENNEIVIVPIQEGNS